MAKFNYRAWKERWRERAAHFGIDTETGATGFQVVIVTAEMRQQATIAQAKTVDGFPWWAADPAMWVDDAPYCQVEREALMNIRLEAMRLRTGRTDEDIVPDPVTVGELWREVRREASLYERRWMPTVAELEALPLMT